MLINKTIKAHATKSVFINIFEKKVPHKAKKNIFLPTCFAVVSCLMNVGLKKRALPTIPN